MSYSVIRARLAVLVITGALVVGPAVAANAAPAAAQSGGAAGLVAAVVQVNDTLNDLTLLSNIGSIEIVTVKGSLNNVLQNARFLNNVTVLQDFLNNSVNNNNVEILKNFLNDNEVLITDVIAVDVLSNGDIVVYRA